MVEIRSSSCRHVRRAAVIAMLLIAAGGCARSLHSIDSARESFVAGDLHAARQSLTEISSSGNRFADAASLDLAIVDLAAGDVAQAESRLRDLRDRFDALPEITPVSEAASLATDDTARTFRPAGYEEIMIRAMLSLCSLAGDQVDAESYALQATTRQTELARRAEQRGVLDVAGAYQPIALAPYLRGILREATHHDYDDATRAYQLVSTVRPQFKPAEADIVRASEGTHSAPGHGVLYVIACVGRGPVLEETTAPTTSAALSLASAVINAEANRTESSDRDRDLVLPNVASVKVPQVVVPTCRTAAVGVRVNGSLYGATQTLTDVGDLAVNQLDAEAPWTIARAVVRRVSKEAAVVKMGDSLGLDGTPGSLFHFAAASTWSGVEHADTRCWGLLPREIQVLRAELPVGQHQIELQPLGWSSDVVAAPQSHLVQIADGRNQYLIVVAPEQTMYIVSPTNKEI
jgi:hypothetical protein